MELHELPELKTRNAKFMEDNGSPHDGRMEHQKKSKEANPKRTLSIYSNLPLNIEKNTGQNMHKTVQGRGKL